MSLFIQDKDVVFLKRQDKDAYYLLHNLVEVQFIDHSRTVTDDFGSQPKLFYHPPVSFPLHVITSDFNYIMDMFGLEEVPEGAAVFSIAVLEALSKNWKERYFPEPDVLFTYHGQEWRVTENYIIDIIGSEDDQFLHYGVTLERNSRTNKITEAGELTLAYANYFSYITASAALDAATIYTGDTIDSETKLFSANLVAQKLYVMTESATPALTSILDVDNQLNIISLFDAPRLETFDGIEYRIYEMANPTTQSYNLQLI